MGNLLDVMENTSAKLDTIQSLITLLLEHYLAGERLTEERARKMELNLHALSNVVELTQYELDKCITQAYKGKGRE